LWKEIEEIEEKFVGKTRRIRCGGRKVGVLKVLGWSVGKLANKNF
jgi:hypothetical protein